ncbi:hypothetical protein DERP_000538 [Dermatophagoides pteronyssinus]|uniref:Uncharacterized protein n=1 Tax=Dermatophagoides pteronyssinus TaxID=6956 RepID=A0ABQ8J0J0_DERPT|nr:hypothetical protein DERP_000538 [Dermatophagoides pteronyssinus]
MSTDIKCESLLGTLNQIHLRPFSIQSFNASVQYQMNLPLVRIEFHPVYNYSFEMKYNGHTYIMEQHKLECEYNVFNEHFYRIHHDDVERC